MSVKLWRKVDPLIESALKYQDEHDLDSIKREIFLKQAQLWEGEKSVIVTQIEEYPKIKKCRIWIAAGDMVELVEKMLPAVEKWAKKENCYAIGVVGRKGWSRVLLDKGYEEPRLTILEKDLING